MKKLLFVLAFFASFAVNAQAMTASPKFAMTMPTTYADTAKTALPLTDIAKTSVYDNGALVWSGTGAVTLTPAVTITSTACALHAFTATVTAVNGLESAQSTATNLFLCQPLAPTTVLIKF